MHRCIICSQNWVNSQVDPYTYNSNSTRFHAFWLVSFKTLQFLLFMQVYIYIYIYIYIYAQIVYNSIWKKISLFSVVSIISFGQKYIYWLININFSPKKNLLYRIFEVPFFFL